MIQKKWFRIETDKEGNILSCVEVSSKGRQGAIVRYYEALDKAEACERAKGWFERRLAVRTACARRRRERLKAAGLCEICAIKPPLAGARLCEPCADRQAANNRRSRSGESKNIRRNPDPLTEQLRQKAVNDAHYTRIKEKWGTWRAHELFLRLKDYDDFKPQKSCPCCQRFREHQLARIRGIGGIPAVIALNEYDDERAKRQGDVPEAAE